MADTEATGGGQGGENPLKGIKLPDNMIPTTENLDKLKRWGMKHYRVNRQRVQEMMGTATITTEPDLEPQVEKLQTQLSKYKELHMVSFYVHLCSKRLVLLAWGGTGQSLQCTDFDTEENGRFLSRNESKIKGPSRGV